MIILRNPSSRISTNILITKMKKNEKIFFGKINMRLLRDYQLSAVHAVQSGIADCERQNSFRNGDRDWENSHLIRNHQNVLRLYNVKRVLFLVDRIELETQAQKEFDEVLKNDFRTVIWKENQSDWTNQKLLSLPFSLLSVGINTGRFSVQTISTSLFPMRRTGLWVQEVERFLNTLSVSNWVSLRPQKII